jgi:hypothetical protein
MHASRLAVAALLLAGKALAQEPHVAPNGPKDQPQTLDSLRWAQLDSATAPLVAQARLTYPGAKRRYLAGLPPGQSFFLTTRLRDSVANREQVFVAVDSIRADRVFGRIWSDITVVRGYRLRQPISFLESAIVDWLITKPDGSEEGNVVGKFLDTYRPPH